MNGFIYTIVALLLVANCATASNTYLRGDADKTVSEQPRVLADEPIMTPTVLPTITPVPVGDCYPPYFNDGSACTLCANGIINFVNPDSDVQECTACGATEYIKNNVCTSSCSCAAEGEWTETYCGYYAFKACAEGFVGTSRRFCDNGVWGEEDSSACHATSDIEHGSGSGMIDIPITLKNYPPFTDNSEIPLYVTKATLNQYPYQLSDLQVVMENIYDNVNTNQIAHVFIRSNSVFGSAISSSVSTSIGQIADKLQSLNNAIFNSEVTSNIEVDTENQKETIEPGVCIYTSQTGSTYETPVGFSSDVFKYDGCPATTDSNQVFQCTQNLLEMIPYTVLYHPCTQATGLDIFTIDIQSVVPIDYIKSNFYKNVYGLILSSIKYPKNLLNVQNSYSEEYNQSGEIISHSYIEIDASIVYSGDHGDLRREIVGIMSSAEFKDDLQKMSGIIITDYSVVAYSS